MEEAQLKRPREEDEEEVSKRSKSYKEILSILDEDEDESTHDFDSASLITTLQQEITSCFSGESPAAGGNDRAPASEEEDETERVMRHLLEASDDELGIPTTAGAGTGGEDWLTPVAVGDALLWEIEDEAANYYTLLQSELFL